jgi:hypothetical protein
VITLAAERGAQVSWAQSLPRVAVRLLLAEWLWRRCHRRWAHSHAARRRCCGGVACRGHRLVTGHTYGGALVLGSPTRWTMRYPTAPAGTTPQGAWASGAASERPLVRYRGMLCVFVVSLTPPDKPPLPPLQPADWRAANSRANNGRERKDLYTDNWDGDVYKGCVQPRIAPASAPAHSLPGQAST